VGWASLLAVSTDGPKEPLTVHALAPTEAHRAAALLDAARGLV
jgi:hypothetical protein